MKKELQIERSVYDIFVRHTLGLPNKVGIREEDYRLVQEKIQNGEVDIEAWIKISLPVGQVVEQPRPRRVPRQASPNVQRRREPHSPPNPAKATIRFLWVCTSSIATLALITYSILLYVPLPARENLAETEWLQSDLVQVLLFKKQQVQHRIVLKKNVSAKVEFSSKKIFRAFCQLKLRNSLSTPLGVGTRILTADKQEVLNKTLTFPEHPTEASEFNLLLPPGTYWVEFDLESETGVAPELDFRLLVRY